MSTALPTRPPTGADLELARQMYGDGDSWGIVEITRYLNARGVKASRQSVARWVDPERAAQHLKQTRDWNRRKRAEQVKQRQVSTEFALGHMAAWKSAGASFASVTAVARVEYGLDLTEDQVRYALKIGRLPSAERDRAA